VHGNTTDIKGLLVHSTCIKTVCSEVHLCTTEPESLTGVIAKPKQNRKRVEPDDATVTVLVVDGRGQQDIRECTAEEDQSQQKGSGVVVGDPSGNHLKEEERGREERKRERQRIEKNRTQKEKRHKQRTEREEKEEKDQELDSYTLVHSMPVFFLPKLYH
jgi:hypothetical protein